MKISDSKLKSFTQVARKVFQRYPVKVAYLFGSVTRNGSLPPKDIDLGVFLDDKKLPPRPEASELEIQLGLELEKLIGEEVDVHILNDAPLSVKGKALEEGKLVFSQDEVFRVNLERSTRHLYLDFKYQLEQIHQGYLKAFAEKGA